MLKISCVMPVARRSHREGASERSDSVGCNCLRPARFGKEFTDKQHPPGCLISTAVLACPPQNQVAAEHTVSLRAQTLGAFRARITEGMVSTNPFCRPHRL
jgi:hypothetical protein